MPPTPWTAFTFFGIPLLLGVLGGIHSLRLFARLYAGHGRVEPPGIDTNPGSTSRDEAGSQRGQLLRAAGLLAVSAVLVAHSGRWLLSIYGYL